MTFSRNADWDIEGREKVFTGGAPRLPSSGHTPRLALGERLSSISDGTAILACDASGKAQETDEVRRLDAFDPDNPALASGGGGPTYRPTAREERRNVLLRRLFTLNLSSNGVVRRFIQLRGIDSVIVLMHRVAQLHGVRVMTFEDFHLVINEMVMSDAVFVAAEVKNQPAKSTAAAVPIRASLPGRGSAGAGGYRHGSLGGTSGGGSGAPSAGGGGNLLVSMAEAKMLFGLFDDNKSGMLDLDEFADGLHLLCDNESIILLKTCKLCAEAAATPLNGVETMISVVEIDLMFTAVANVYNRPPALVAGLRTLREAMALKAFRGEVSSTIFQRELSQMPDIHAVLLRLPVESSSNEEEPTAPSTTTNGKSSSSVPLGAPDAQMVAAGLAMSAATSPPDDSHGDPMKAAGAAAGASSVARGIAYAALDLTHPGFKGDMYKHGDEIKQLLANERNNPVWYSSRGQVWRCSDSEAPAPVLEM